MTSLKEKIITLVARAIQEGNFEVISTTYDKIQIPVKIIAEVNFKGFAIDVDLSQILEKVKDD